MDVVEIAKNEIEVINRISIATGKALIVEVLKLRAELHNPLAGYQPIECGNKSEPPKSE